MHADLRNKQVHDFRHQTLLRLERSLGERMRQIPAHLGVYGDIALAHDRMCLIGEAAAVVEGALDERLVALAEAVDVFPRAGAAEG